MKWGLTEFKMLTRTTNTTKSIKIIILLIDHLGSLDNRVVKWLSIENREIILSFLLPGFFFPLMFMVWKSSFAFQNLLWAMPLLQCPLTLVPAVSLIAAATAAGPASPGPCHSQASASPGVATKLGHNSFWAGSRAASSLNLSSKDQR